ncbi:MAG: YceI family protein [Bacteroidales bacterium]|jgi:polyisoprenoid-binding protein YceI|nr:YceI family protein [Bacteroidales bacterium]
MKTIKTILATAMILLSVSVFAQKMKIDSEKSSLKWHGEKVTGEHFGHIDLKEGWLHWDNNKLTGGAFVIDMSTITNTDLEDAQYNAKLVNHLKSDDFFGVEKFPTAKLELKGSEKFTDNKAKVKAHLTIKDITHPIEFEAQKDGNWFMAEIVIDRSKYDVRYGSGSFFENLGDKMIYDDFTMTVKIATVN